MKPEQVQAYRDQLLRLDGQLDTAIDHLEEEIAVGGMSAGESDPFTRRSIDAELEIERNEEGIQHMVKAALNRIEHGNFGVCEDCGGKIAKARLDALPYTPYCIECETKREEM